MLSGEIALRNNHYYYFKRNLDNGRNRAYMILSKINAKQTIIVELYL